MIRRRMQQGFSLIELSMVLVIIAILIGSALTSGKSRLTFAQMNQTQQKLDKIEAAVAAHLALNGFLPCPAVGSLASGVAGFGDADCAGTLVDTADPDVHVGMIPINALNLSDDFLLDGWDHRFTYAVDSHFVKAADFDFYPNGSITINNSAGVARTAQAVLALVSYGPNGHGAWPKKGGAARINAASADAGEQENADDPATNAVLTDKVFVQSTTTSTYDDTVRYKMKSTALRDAGGIINPDDCADPTTDECPNLCMDAQRTLLPINDYPLQDDGVTLDPDKPLEGPVGCHDEANVPPADYNTECIVRQVRLAELIAERCVH